MLKFLSYIGLILDIISYAKRLWQQFREPKPILPVTSIRREAVKESLKPANKTPEASDTSSNPGVTSPSKPLVPLNIERQEVTDALKCLQSVECQMQNDNPGEIEKHFRKEFET